MCSISSLEEAKTVILEIQMNSAGSNQFKSISSTTTREDLNKNNYALGNFALDDDIAHRN